MCDRVCRPIWAPGLKEIEALSIWFNVELDYLSLESIWWPFCQPFWKSTTVYFTYGFEININTLFTCEKLMEIDTRNVMLYMSIIHSDMAICLLKQPFWRPYWIFQLYFLWYWLVHGPNRFFTYDNIGIDTKIIVLYFLFTELWANCDFRWIRRPYWILTSFRNFRLSGLLVCWSGD